MTVKLTTITGQLSVASSGGDPIEVATFEVPLDAAVDERLDGVTVNITGDIKQAIATALRTLADELDG